MQITITGPRGGGATTLAAIIHEALVSRGVLVRYVSRFPKDASELGAIADAADRQLMRMSTVVIVEGVEPEDESSVANRRPVWTGGLAMSEDVATDEAAGSIPCPVCGHSAPKTCAGCGGLEGLAGIPPCLICRRRGPFPTEQPLGDPIISTP